METMEEFRTFRGRNGTGHLRIVGLEVDIQRICVATITWSYLASLILKMRGRFPKEMKRTGDAAVNRCALSSFARKCPIRTACKRSKLGYEEELE